METRNLGTSGLQVSAVGLGCNNFGGRIGPEESRAVVHKALDLGITLFDTADSYGNRGGSEEALGQILGEHRKHIVLATKFGLPMDEARILSGASRRYIMHAVEASLRRLRTDWIDLYQLHTPDPKTPIEETLRALDDLIRHGKVRYVGNSNFAGWEVVDAHWTAHDRNLHRFVSCQNEYSLLKRDIEAELVPAVQACGLGLLPYFPLAAGLLTGKYQRQAPPPPGTRFARMTGLAERYLTPANWAILERLEELCARRGHGLLELAFSWLASRPCVASVIAGATKPEQVEQNVRAVGWALTPEDLAEVDGITGTP
ncbi:MAG TPA: aldo/keto reductase [Xanthobacteraceae bacterium]|jgi:aryl-alcohol dehydrogenase-like predicted oxidoreductase